MTNLNTSTDFKKLIDLAGFGMNHKGIAVRYFIFDKQEVIIANQVQAAELFKLAGYINNYAGVGESLMIQLGVNYQTVNIDGVMVDNIIFETLTWSQFSEKWELTEQIAKELAIMREREKSGRGEQVFLNVLSKLKRNTMQPMELTPAEMQVFASLAAVSDETAWGKSIQQVHANPDPVLISHLLGQLKNQVKADPEMMTNILGPVYYESISTL